MFVRAVRWSFRCFTTQEYVPSPPFTLPPLPPILLPFLSSSLSYPFLSLPPLVSPTCASPYPHLNSSPLFSPPCSSSSLSFTSLLFVVPVLSPIPSPHPSFLFLPSCLFHPVLPSHFFPHFFSFLSRVSFLLSFHPLPFPYPPSLPFCPCLFLSLFLLLSILLPLTHLSFPPFSYKLFHRCFTFLSPSDPHFSLSFLSAHISLPSWVLPCPPLPLYPPLIPLSFSLLFYLLSLTLLLPYPAFYLTLPLLFFFPIYTLVASSNPVCPSLSFHAYLVAFFFLLFWVSSIHDEGSSLYKDSRLLFLVVKQL